MSRDHSEFHGNDTGELIPQLHPVLSSMLLRQLKQLMESQQLNMTQQ